MEKLLLRGSRSFNPLPSPKQGETLSPLRIMNTIKSFNPLPSPKQGETRGCGSGGLGFLFQSAPLTEARGDSPRAASRARASCFNPLPSPKQGETRLHRDLARRCRVSIRSPHRSKGRPIPPRSRRRRIHCFNPLPSPKQGETQRPRRAANRLLGFNPLPSPKQGETSLSGLSNAHRPVSIRSPHRSKGRPSTVPCCAVVPLFQSAPLTEARGDYRGASGCSSGQSVSIRSPHRSKGRRDETA